MTIPSRASSKNASFASYRRASERSIGLGSLSRISPFYSFQTFRLIAVSFQAVTVVRRNTRAWRVAEILITLSQSSGRPVLHSHLQVNHNIFKLAAKPLFLSRQLAVSLPGCRPGRTSTPLFSQNPGGSHGFQNQCRCTGIRKATISLANTRRSKSFALKKGGENHHARAVLGELGERKMSILALSATRVTRKLFHSSSVAAYRTR